jgi:hypothetical protein
MNVNIDTKEYVSNLKQLIEDGQEVALTVVGWSMEPILRNQRDRVLLKKPTKPLKIGDIVFYQRKSGQFVLHRIFKIRSEGCYMMGDHQIDLEGPIENAAIFAIVTEVERNGRWISADAFCWKFICGAWRALYPVRKLAYRLRKAIRK